MLYLVDVVTNFELQIYADKHRSELRVSDKLQFVVVAAKINFKIVTSRSSPATPVDNVTTN
jgi:hypothetical protein